MAIIAKNKFIVEDIVNESGDKIGEIKFNPNDSAIMKSLTDIMNDLSTAIEKLKKYDGKDLTKIKQMTTIEEFEQVGKEFEQISEIFKIEYEIISDSIEKLKKIFGEECINCFTGGTMDVEALIPLLEYIAPYIQENRKSKVSKYIKDKDVEVLE